MIASKISRYTKLQFEHDIITTRKRVGLEPQRRRVDFSKRHKVLQS